MLLRIALGFVLALIFWIHFQGVVFGNESVSTNEKVHVVRHGETVWGIAERYYDGDPRRYSYEIGRLNGLENYLIVPGQTLRLP
jgi:nucleoid-associated protein YgaU